MTKQEFNALLHSPDDGKLKNLFADAMVRGCALALRIAASTDEQAMRYVNSFMDGGVKAHVSGLLETNLDIMKHTRHTLSSMISNECRDILRRMYVFALITANRECGFLKRNTAMCAYKNGTLNMYGTQSPWGQNAKGKQLLDNGNYNDYTSAATVEEDTMNLFLGLFLNKNAFSRWRTVALWLIAPYAAAWNTTAYMNPSKIETDREWWMPSVAYTSTGGGGLNLDALKLKKLLNHSSTLPAGNGLHTLHLYDHIAPYVANYLAGAFGYGAWDGTHALNSHTKTFLTGQHIFSKLASIDVFKSNDSAAAFINRTAFMLASIGVNNDGDTAQAVYDERLITRSGPKALGLISITDPNHAYLLKHKRGGEETRVVFSVAYLNNFRVGFKTWMKVNATDVLKTSATMSSDIAIPSAFSMCAMFEGRMHLPLNNPNWSNYESAYRIKPFSKVNDPSPQHKYNSDIILINGGELNDKDVDKTKTKNVPSVHENPDPVIFVPNEEPEPKPKPKAKTNNEINKDSQQSPLDWV